MQQMSQILAVIHSEIGALRRIPKLWLCAVAVVLTPAFYALVYLSSVWDPQAHTSALPVAVVNLDKGIQAGEQTFNVGNDIVQKLVQSHQFGFVLQPDADLARTQVATGKRAFAVIIPSDFSANAVPGNQAGAGKVVVVTSEGNNFQSANMARQFAQALERDVNETMNARRWAVVLRNAAGSQRGVERLREGVMQVVNGANELHTGTEKANTAMQSLVQGHRDLSKGLGDLQKGAEQLRGAAQNFRNEVSDSLFTSSQDVDQMDQFLQGMTQLQNGIRAAGQGEDRLLDGAQRVGVGLEQLNDGSQRLLAGIALLAEAVPSNLPTVGGSAEGLANSVETSVETLAPVENSGSGFAANVIPAALWLGAGVVSFFIRFRLLSQTTMAYRRRVQFAGKFSIPAVVVFLQTLVVIVTALLLFKIQVLLPWAFALTLLVSALAFLAIIFALTKVFGDVGKGVAMFLLAIQLSSSGGVLPVELSGSLYTTISPWLPLTWVVHSLKASMFGAYNGAWLLPMLQVAAIGLAATAISCWRGRWRFVDGSKWEPALDL